jgi:hypothetical protein
MATLSVGGQLVATNDTLSNGVQDNITRLGTVASGVIGSTVTGTIGTGVTFPAGHIIKKSAFHNNDLVTISANVNGASLFTQTFTAQATNSAYYFSGTFASASNETGSADSGDRCYLAWLSDSSSNKYYFGYYRTSTRYSTPANANSGNYFLTESDGGYYGNSTWNQSWYTFTDIPGNQSSYDNTTVVPSVYTAGETLTLHVWGASYNGFYFNQAHSGGNPAGNAYSHFCITESAG